VTAPSGSPKLRYSTSCPSQKRSYHDKAGAKTARRDMRSARGLAVYRCNLCQLWHVGSLPAHVLAGEEPRSVLVTLPRARPWDRAGAAR